MKLHLATLLFSAATVITVSRPTFAQGVIGDASASFQGVSALQAQIELRPLDESKTGENLETLTRLRDQLATENSGFALIDIDQSRLKEFTTAARLPLPPSTLLTTPTSVPEPSMLALATIAVMYFGLRHRNKQTCGR
jgi:hypothetical protein